LESVPKLIYSAEANGSN